MPELNEDGLKRVTVQLDDDLHRQVKLWAVQNDVSMNDIFVEAILAYMKQEAGTDDTNSCQI